MTIGEEGLDARRHRYARLSARCSRLSTRDLTELLEVDDARSGWGIAQTIRLGRERVFVKRIPLTERERESGYSTANLYDLPMAYHYGVGSAGFGAFRELAAHVATTGWVLAGDHPDFPLLYHSRIVPRTGERREHDPADMRRYLAYWNDDEGIAGYVRDREAADHELVLFLEHFPGDARGWLARDPQSSSDYIERMRATIDFLGTRGIAHLDINSENILMHDGVPYLTDFGLLLDRRFELSPEEAAFLRRHRDFDLASFEMSLAFGLFSCYGRLPARGRGRLDARFGIGPDSSIPDLVLTLLANLEPIHAERMIALDDRYVTEVLAHREIITTLAAFMGELRTDDRKSTRYPATRLRALVKAGS